MKLKKILITLAVLGVALIAPKAGHSLTVEYPPVDAFGLSNTTVTINPPAGKVYLYASEDKIYIRDSSGNVCNLATFLGLSDTDLTSIATGDTLYYDGSNWVNLGVGSPGQVLKVNPGATAPEWSADVSVDTLEATTAATLPSTTLTGDLDANNNKLGDVLSLLLTETTEPATPATGHQYIYATNDTVYQKLSDGSSRVLGGNSITFNQGAISLGLDDTYILHRMDFPKGRTIYNWYWGISETDGTSLSNTHCYLQIYNISDSTQAASTQSSYTDGNPIGTYSVSGDTVKFEMVNNKQHVEGAVANDGGTLTDETASAQTATVDDMTLLPSTPATGDSYRFGFTTNTEDTLRINISTAGDYTGSITWRYWDGAAWSNLSGVTDGTNSFKNSGVHDVTFTIPGDWAESTIEGYTCYWIEAYLSSYSSVTIAPKGAESWTGKVRTLSSFITFSVEES